MPAAGFALVVPVKRLARAKTRLAGVAGPLRADLALAFASDTVLAALSCPRVVCVVVVTDEPRAAIELGALGALVVADAPGAGLNPALAHGAGCAARVRPGAGVGALSADLPALRPEELTEVLAAAQDHPAAFLPDAQGDGTTLLVADTIQRFRPRFGPSSAARHRRGGAAELSVDAASAASVRRDVDVPADLVAAVRLGVGPRTADVLSRLGVAGFGTVGGHNQRPPLGEAGAIGSR